LTTTVSRPFGITVLVILRVIAAVLAIGGGILLAVLGGFVRRPFLGAVAEVTAIILEIMAILSLVVSYGLWIGKGWAWLLTLVLACVSAVFALIGVATGHIGRLISLIIEAAVIYYLNTPHVKAFFGRK
jgi:hypothetical protein